MVAVLYLHALVPILPLPARRDPLARSAGWPGMAARLAEAGRARAGGAFYGADRYQDASELAYQLPGRPATFCVCLTARHNQYELWPSFPETARPGDALILALDETPGRHDAVSIAEA